MRLNEFIHDTLYEIALGIQIGSARSIELIAIAPNTLNNEPVGEKTYIDFDIAIVVGESDTTTKGGSGKIDGKIQVASVLKAGLSTGGKLESESTASSQQTHRIAFKVPVYIAANYKTNTLALAHAKQFLAEHGIPDTKVNPKE